MYFLHCHLFCIHCVPIKIRHETFGHNVGRCKPAFRMFSMAYFLRKLIRIDAINFPPHLRYVSLHYLVKL